MIHKVEVGPATEVLEFKKQLRKKLMTGGAVTVIQEGLSESEIEVIYERFRPLAENHNACMTVLIALASAKLLPPTIKRKLEELGSSFIDEALRKRG